MFLSSRGSCISIYLSLLSIYRLLFFLSIYIFLVHVSFLILYCFVLLFYELRLIIGPLVPSSQPAPVSGVKFLLNPFIDLNTSFISNINEIFAIKKRADCV